MTANILANMDSYRSEKTISQAIRFFEAFGMSFTKTMIQNYVRVGVLPPPAAKRYYVKEHMIRLAVIYELKEIYSLPEISRLFELYLKTGEEDELEAFYNDFRHEFFDFFGQLIEFVESKYMISIHRPVV